MTNKLILLPHFDINFMMMSISERKNYGIELHNVPESWKITRGEGIRVAIIDTGLPVHRDLDNMIVASANFTNDPIEDLVVGHSTHVCGIIAAEENDEGVVGIAPKSELIIAKALGDDGSGDDQSLAHAIDWCVSQGAHVINMSLGAPAGAEGQFVKTRRAVIAAYKKGVVIVCASGNENANNVGVPAKWDECIAIGAVDNKKQRANFSNKGKELDFAASGVNITSSFTDNTYASLSGTSMACPQIAGICALILSEHRGNQPGRRTPINGPADVVDHLKKICIDLGETGFDSDYGFGLPVYGKIITEQPKPLPKKTWIDSMMEWLRSKISF